MASTTPPIATFSTLTPDDAEPPDSLATNHGIKTSLRSNQLTFFKPARIHIMSFREYLRRLFSRAKFTGTQSPNLDCLQDVSKEVAVKPGTVSAETVSREQTTTSTAKAGLTVNNATETISREPPEALDSESTADNDIVDKIAPCSRAQPSGSGREKESRIIIPFGIDAHHFEPTKLTLEDMPGEMVLAISNYLEPVTRGALALASRTLFLKLGANAVKLDDPSRRYELLLLLARDNKYLPLTLCSFCHIFHRPIQSSTTTLNHGERFKLQKCQMQSPILDRFDNNAMAKYLPSGVHQSIINAVLESYAHDVPTLKLPLDTDSHKISTGTGTILLNYSLAIVKNHILLKTERIIIPCKGNDAAEVLAAAKRLGQIIESSEHSRLLNNTCEHMTRLRHRHATLFGISTSTARLRRFECIWTHPLGCGCCSEGVFEKRPCVTACNSCFTDTGLDIRDLPNNGGRALIVTTWRDLGSRLPNSQWKCHRYYLPSLTVWRSWFASPTVLLDFEGEDASLGAEDNEKCVNCNLQVLPELESQSSWPERAKYKAWGSLYWF